MLSTLDSLIVFVLLLDQWEYEWLWVELDMKLLDGPGAREVGQRVVAAVDGNKKVDCVGVHTSRWRRLSAVTLEYRTVDIPLVYVM